MHISQFTKKPATKKTAFLTAAAFAFICISAAIVDKSNFTGEWTLNEKKSDLGEFGARFTPKKIKVEQKEDGLSIERVISFNGEDRTTSEKLTLDGKESENTVFNNSKKKSTAKWSDDGQTLTVNSVTKLDRNGEILEIKSTETWKLMNEGKSLSLETVSTSSMGTNDVKAVFDKAK